MSSSEGNAKNSLIQLGYAMQDRGQRQCETLAKKLEDNFDLDALFQALDEAYQDEESTSIATACRGLEYLCTDRERKIYKQCMEMLQAEENESKSRLLSFFQAGIEHESSDISSATLKLLSEWGKSSQQVANTLATATGVVYSSLELLVENDPEGDDFATTRCCYASSQLFRSLLGKSTKQLEIMEQLLSKVSTPSSRIPEQDLRVYEVILRAIGDGGLTEDMTDRSGSLQKIREVLASNDPLFVMNLLEQIPSAGRSASGCKCMWKAGILDALAKIAGARGELRADGDIPSREDLDSKHAPDPFMHGQALECLSICTFLCIRMLADANCTSDAAKIYNAYVPGILGRGTHNLSEDRSVVMRSLCGISFAVQSCFNGMQLWITSNCFDSWAKISSANDKELLLTFIHFLGDVLYTLAKHDTEKVSVPSLADFKIPPATSLTQTNGEDDPCELSRQLISALDRAAGEFLPRIFKLAQRSTNDEVAPFLKLFHAVSTLPERYGVELLSKIAGFVEWVQNVKCSVMHNEIQSITSTLGSRMS